jgi:hypothetical protein
METQGRSYLVLLFDVATDTTFTQVVKAVSGFDAGAYALNFDSVGHAREDGYKVLVVLSSPDLKKFAEELDTFTGPIVPRGDPSKIEFPEGIVTSN